MFHFSKSKPKDRPSECRRRRIADIILPMNDDFVKFCREHGIAESRAVDVSSGVSPLGPSGRVKAVIRKAVKDIGEPPDAIQERFCRLLFSRFGIQPACAVVSGSLDGLVYRTARVLGPKKVLIAGPAPDVYSDAASAAGGEALVVSAFKGEEFTPAVESLVGRLQGVGLLVLSNPNRITGRLMSPGEMDRLLAAAAAGGTVTLIDESLMEFTGEAGLFGSARGGVIVVRTTSLFFGMPGLELAYAAAPEELAARISRADHGVVSRLAVEAARAALKDKTYHKQMQKFLSSERRLLERSLGSVPDVRLYASDANVSLLRSEGPHDGPIRAALARAGFFIRDCRGMEGLGHGYLRVAVMGHGANRKFVRIIRERSAPEGP